MESNFEYISGNYITEEKLCDITEITKDKLNALIQNHLVPEASYVVTRSIKITSPLNDEFQTEITEKYFSKNCVSLIQKNKETKDSHEYKAEFREKFIQNLMKHPDRNFAYHNAFNNDQEKLEEIFESEWEAYCNGIYGICTIHSTEEDIVRKEVAVKKLIHFNTLFSQKTLNENETEELIQLNKEFNEVAERFAPYQRASSSRGKYLDEILENNSLGYLIKKY